MRHAFDAALAAIERREPEPPLPPPLAFAGRVAEVAVAPASPPANGHSLWDLAADWTPEADPMPPPPPAAAPPPSAQPEDIAAELDLFALRNSADIARARRRFMWNNHPDRRGDIDAGLANRRVAIANMLLDRVLALLTRKRAR